MSTCSHGWAVENYVKCPRCHDRKEWEKKLNEAREDTRVARESLYEVVSQRNAAYSEVRRLERELVLARAHDSQPYPTAEAYEKVCALLHGSKAHVAVLEAAIHRAAREQARVVDATKKSVRQIVVEEAARVVNGCRLDGGEGYSIFERLIADNSIDAALNAIRSLTSPKEEVVNPQQEEKTMNVRAKFRVTSIQLFSSNPAIQVEMSAVTNDGTPENQRFHKYTPSATLRMAVDNPPVAEHFKSLLGKDVYVDFTPVE